VHLTHKIAVAAGALTLAATGIAGATDSPPDAADQGLTTASEHVGVELPATKDAHPDGSSVEQDDDATTDESADATEDESDDEGTGPVDNHGAEVSAVAQSDETTGRAHGEAVSEVARAGHGEDAGSTGEEHRADQAELGAANAGEHGKP
jgi:hypothetical protein